MSKTIDNLDMGAHEEYARRIRDFEITNDQLRFDQAVTIPQQTQIVDFQTKPSELFLLFGYNSVLTPFAHFPLPPAFRKRRRFPFSYKIIPSLSLKEEDECEKAVKQRDCKSDEERREQEILLHFFDQINEINGWISHILGARGQYLKG